MELKSIESKQVYLFVEMKRFALALWRAHSLLTINNETHTTKDKTVLILQ
tara:strand:- start:511 stop:660 length:150 start_codon:yes stop_codon:yes gene_type:complete